MRCKSLRRREGNAASNLHFSQRLLHFQNSRARKRFAIELDFDLSGVWPSHPDCGRVLPGAPKEKFSKLEVWRRIRECVARGF